MDRVGSRAASNIRAVVEYIVKADRAIRVLEQTGRRL